MEGVLSVAEKSGLTPVQIPNIMVFYRRIVSDRRPVYLKFESVLDQTSRRRQVQSTP